MRKANSSPQVRSNGRTFIVGEQRWHHGIVCGDVTKICFLSVIVDDRIFFCSYESMAIVWESALGAIITDIEGKEYIDCLSAYSATNQGHSHPRIVRAAHEQMQKACLSSRAFYNSVLPCFTREITSMFGFDMVLPMNTGAEAVETALKLTRKWGYLKKGIPKDRAIIISAKGNFHGRTLAIVSMSDDPTAYEDYGPMMPGLAGYSVPYDDIDALEAMLKSHGEYVAGFLVEPIQGEAGIVVPEDGYLRRAKELCEKYNCLLIVDEIQTGLGRTGKLCCFEHDGIKPDIVTLGKALSGGVYPVSAVLASYDVMLLMKPGTHGSTYGGNPVGMRVAIEALRVIRDEKLVERAADLGPYLQDQLTKRDHPFIKQVRGRGLLIGVVIDSEALAKAGKDAGAAKTLGAIDVCMLAAERGVLVKPTHEHIIRIAPPLVISKEILDKVVSIFFSALDDIVSTDVSQLRVFQQAKSGKEAAAAVRQGT